jgi:hypothetical protein
MMSQTGPVTMNDYTTSIIHETPHTYKKKKKKKTSENQIPTIKIPLILENYPTLLIPYLLSLLPVLYI